ncbi:MAG: putative ABC exporter domain-containing protein [Thermoguttaceae bacterium]
MNRALWKLLYLRLYGGVRRRVNSLRGLLLSLLGILVLAAFVGPAVVIRQPISIDLLGLSLTFDPSATDQFMPLALLGGCLLTLLTARGPALYFNPAEVNFLFSGPFSRREVLLYKVASYAVGALISGACVALVAGRMAGGWLPAVAGSFLAFVFIQLFSACVGFGAQQIAPGRRWWFQGAAGLAAVALSYVVVAGLVAGGPEQTFAVRWQAFRGSPLGMGLLAPFEVFTRTFLAGNLPELAWWGLIGLAIDVGLLAVMLRIGDHSFEAVEEASVEMRRKWLQMWHGPLGSELGVCRGWSFRILPRMAGVGPLVWRQGLTALRTSGRVLLLLSVAAVASGPVLVLAVKGGVSVWTVVGLVLTTTVFVLPRVFLFDFRADVDHLGRLKSLPLGSLAVVIGQLTTPVCLATVTHWLVIAGAATAIPPQHAWLLILAALVSPPFNLVHYGLENLLFLLFPSRLAPVGRIDFEFFGRTLLDLSIKMFFLTLCSLAAAMVAVVVYAFTGGAVYAAILAAALVFGAAAAALLVPLTWAYRRLDVGRQTPE